MCKFLAGIYADINQYDYAGSVWTGTGVNASTSIINVTVILPGIFVGCQPIESLLQSTTECLFEEACLKEISSYVNYSMIPIQPFSVPNRSRFPPQTTIETLVNELFVE